MSKIVSNYKTNYSVKKSAFPYQAQAFNEIKDLTYSAIFHEQGLGKTKIAIDLLLYWLQYKKIDTVLIVTKKQLVKNWLDEFKNHTYLRPKVLSNNRAENFYIFNSPAKVIVTNFETISVEKERVKLFLKARDVAIIIDESAKIKNPDSKLTKDFFELAELFKIRTIMTGTPVANRPYDIWAQIYFLDFGKSLGKDYKSFRRENDLTNKLHSDQEAQSKLGEALASIYGRIDNFAVRETKASSGIELPNKKYETVICDFEKEQVKLYNKVIYELEIEVKKNGTMVIDDESAALKRLLRLNQVASNPKLIDDNYDKESGKEKKLEELITNIMNKEEKCIVWSIFIDNVEQFCKKYDKYGSRKIHGHMTIDERNEAIDDFKNNNECRLLFATPQSAKEGLTLTVANHVVFYDRGFNLDDYLQAQDRIHRISQKKTCYIYNMMIRDSIDEWIDGLLESKHYAALLTQGDIDKEEYTQKMDYSYGEIVKDILGMGGQHE